MTTSVHRAHCRKPVGPDDLRRGIKNSRSPPKAPSHRLAIPGEPDSQLPLPRARGRGRPGHLFFTVNPYLHRFRAMSKHGRPHQNRPLHTTRHNSRLRNPQALKGPRFPLRAAPGVRGPSLTFLLPTDRPNALHWVPFSLVSVVTLMSETR